MRLFIGLSAGLILVVAYTVALENFIKRQLDNNKKRRRSGYLCHRLFHKKKLISALCLNRIERGYYMTQQCDMTNKSLAFVYFLNENMWRVPDEAVDWERAAKAYQEIAKSPWTDRPIHEEFFRGVLRPCLSTQGKRNILRTPDSLRSWNALVQRWPEPIDPPQKETIQSPQMISKPVL